jgi:hypothetical protein
LLSTKHLAPSSLALCSILFAAGCGPSCPEVKAALDEDEAMAGDVARVNALVDKRESAVIEAGGGDHDQFEMQRLKFSVTAFELAIEIQVRIIKISPRYEDSDLYEQQAELINEIRCELDELIALDGHEISDRLGRDIQALHKQLATLLRKEGQVSDSELKTYYEEGIGGKGE